MKKSFKVFWAIFAVLGWVLYVGTRINIENVRMEASSAMEGAAQEQSQKSADVAAWLGIVYTLNNSLDVMNAQFAYGQVTGSAWWNTSNYDTVDELCGDVVEYAPDDYSVDAQKIASQARTVIGEVKYAGTSVTPTFNRNISYQMADIQRTVEKIFDQSAEGCSVPMHNTGTTNTDVWMSVRSKIYTVLPPVPGHPDF